MINQQHISQLSFEPMFVTVFTNSQNIKFNLGNIERDKWAFERLLLDSRYESWLRRRAMRRSLHHTTRIEGNTLNEEQVGGILEGEKIQADKKQVAEIENGNRAYQFIDSISDNINVPIDEGVIRHINALFLGDTDPVLTPGEYRKGQNWVRHYMTGKRIYTPPNQGDVPALMREFSNWLKKENKGIHAVLIAGIAHLRLVEIHPFWDGNGRTARALTTLVLQRLGYGFNKLLSFERYVDLDLPNYFNAISKVVGEQYKAQREMTAWLEYFSNALSIEISLVSDYLVDFRRAMENWHKSFVDKYHINGRQIDALAYAFLHDGIRPRDYMQYCRVSHETARRDLQRLVDIRLLRATGHGRARKYIFVSREQSQPKRES
jgi:Fic family protein